jgi:hypothetical protein
MPQTLKETKSFIKQAPTLTFPTISQGYEGASYDSDYGGFAQTWLLIRSELACKHEQHKKRVSQFHSLSASNFTDASECNLPVIALATGG